MMRKSVMENLPKFLFPGEFEESLQTESEAVKVTDELDARCMTAAMSLRASNIEYMIGELSDLAYNGLTRSIRRFSDGSMVVRIGSWEFEVNNAQFGRENHFALHVDENFNVISYTLYMTDMGGGRFMRGNGQILARRDIPSFCRKVADMHTWDVARIAPESTVPSIAEIRKNESNTTFFMIVKYLHIPWWFIRRGLDSDEMNRAITSFSAGGYRALFKTLNPDYLPFLHPDAHSGFSYTTRRIGVRMRLLHHRMFAEIFGQEKNVAAFEGIGIDFKPTTPLWVSLRTAEWPTMMDELAYLAGDTESFSSEQDRIQMLAYSALGGSAHGRERLFNLAGIEFDEPAVDYCGRFPPSEKIFESFMRYRKIARRPTS